MQRLCRPWPGRPRGPRLYLSAARPASVPSAVRRRPRRAPPGAAAKARRRAVRRGPAWLVQCWQKRKSKFSGSIFSFFTLVPFRGRLHTTFRLLEVGGERAGAALTCASMRSHAARRSTAARPTTHRFWPARRLPLFFAGCAPLFVRLVRNRQISLTTPTHDHGRGEATVEALRKREAEGAGPLWAWAKGW